jgi:membrane fusion protein, multidrug efflux system
MKMNKLHTRVLGVALLLACIWAMVRMIGGASVDVVYPTRGRAVLAVYATGTVEATVMFPIAPRISAKLAQLHVDEGQQVSKGQVLARLDDEDLQSSLRQFQAQEVLAKQTYDRKSTLVRSGTITKADFDNAKAEWELAKAQTARAISEMNFMKLVAPNDGTIIKRDGEVGQLIPVQQAVFWMSCCAPLRISVEVNEEDIAQVKPDQEVLIQADAFPDQIFKGKVQSITPMGNAIARTYRVRIAFAEKNPLHIGMTAETNILISQHDNALLVPSSAVVNQQLWLVRDSKLVLQDVKIGAKGLKNSEILSGVQEGDAVVLRPLPDFKAGESVRPHVIELR